MLRTVLMCKACTVFKSTSQVFSTKTFKKREISCAPPLTLVTLNKITIYKNCTSIAVPWGHGLSDRVIRLPWHDIMPPMGCTPQFEKDWYILVLLRTLQAGIENTSHLLKSLSRLPRKNSGSFICFSTVAIYRNTLWN